MLRFVDRHRTFFAVASEHGLTGAMPPSSTAALSGSTANPFAEINADFLALVREGIEEGALRGDAVRLARFLGGTIRSLVAGAGEDGRARTEDEVPAIVGLFLHGAATSHVGAGRDAAAGKPAPRKKRAASSLR